MSISFLIRYLFNWLLGISRKKPEEKQDDIIEAIMKAIPKSGREAIEGHEFDIRILLRLSLQAVGKFKILPQARDTKNLLSSIKIPAFGRYHEDIMQAILHGDVSGLDNNTRHEMYGAYMMAFLYLMNLQGYTDFEVPSVTEQPPETQAAQVKPSTTDVRQDEPDEPAPEHVEYDRDQY